MENVANLLDDEDFEENIETYDKTKFKFRVNAKTFFLTYPQCPIDEETFFFMIQKILLQKNRNIKLAVCSSEYHNQTEGKHIHIYFELDKKIHLRDSSFFDVIDDDSNVYHPNIQKPKNKAKVIKYVSGLTKKKINDEKHVYEFNINVKKYLYRQLKHLRYIYEDLILKKVSLVDAVGVEPNIIAQYTKMKRNLESYWADSSGKEFKSQRLCFWIYGPPGIGKSYSVRSSFDDIYIKESNKWWDGYISQKIVLIDDFDSSSLSHYIKIWADNYKFIGEIKGGVVECMYNVLFITSNYTIEGIFSDKNNKNSSLLINAIKRRFNLVDALSYMDNQYFKLPENIKHEIINHI